MARILSELFLTIVRMQDPQSQGKGKVGGEPYEGKRAAGPDPKTESVSNLPEKAGLGSPPFVCEKVSASEC